MLTERDLKALEFIQKNPCRSDIIEKLFYPSYRVAMKRLSVMVDDGYCKRYRETPNHKYFYYCKSRPKHLEHFDLTARSILWIQSQGYKVVSFRREVKLDGAKPDAIAGIKKNGQYGILMIEIERFNNRLPKKIHLYEKEIKSKSHFSTFKILYVCTSKVENDLISIINISPNELKSV